MLESVRRHTSLLVAVGAIVVLAASQVTAQEGATKPGVEQEAVRPAGVNADTVDGRHAIGAAAEPGERGGMLVATNAQGYLPNDIILKAKNADTLDGLDSSAFPLARTLKSDAGAVNQADNPVHWRQIKGVPAGIADGKDAVGLGRGFYTKTQWVTLGGAGFPFTLRCEAGDLPMSGGIQAFDDSSWNITTSIPYLSDEPPGWMWEIAVDPAIGDAMFGSSFWVVCADMTP